MSVKETINSVFAKLPFRILAEKIPAQTIAKFPMLGKAIPFSNQIACGIMAVLIMTGVTIGSVSAQSGGSSSLSEDSDTVIVVSQAIYMNMSSKSIAEINSFPQISVVIEDNEKVKHDWEIIKKAYNIKNDEVVRDSEHIGLLITLSYGNPSAGAIIVASFARPDGNYYKSPVEYAYLRQRWVYLLNDTKGLLPRHKMAEAERLIGRF
jgi:hypothetical protein